MLYTVPIHCYAPTDQRLRPAKQAGTERISEAGKAEAARANATLRTKKQMRADQLRESRNKKRDRGMDQRVKSEAAAGALPSVSFTPRVPSSCCTSVRVVLRHTNTITTIHVPRRTCALRMQHAISSWFVHVSCAAEKKREIQEKELARLLKAGACARLALLPWPASVQATKHRCAYTPDTVVHIYALVNVSACPSIERLHVLHSISSKSQLIICCRFPTKCRISSVIRVVWWYASSTT